MRISISSLSGCGATTTAELVAKQLGLHKVNYTLRDLGKEKGLSLEQMQAQAKEGPEIDFALDRKLVESARAENVVLASRLAVWLIPQADLRVWLHASARTRAKRIAQRENRPLAETTKEIKWRDSQNQERYKKYYKLNVKKFTEQVHVVINTESIDAEHVTSLIADAAKRAPYKVDKAAERKVKKLHAILFNK